MKLQFYPPSNKLLKNYVEGYYFICDNETEGSERYWTFPNNYCIVTTNLNSSVELEETKISIRPSETENVYTSFVYRYVTPIEVYYEKPINEITIYFKPLGLNNFVENLETMFSKNKMTEFTPEFVNFQSVMREIFQSEDRRLQIEKLENYWISKFTKKDLALVENILTDVEGNMKIEEIAQKNKISRKHLHKIFRKSIGKSPAEYRKIYRFRSALNNMKNLKNLTDLSYENLFYDQSHLIKDFRSLTGINPKTFFKNVNTNNKNVWLFI